MAQGDISAVKALTFDVFGTVVDWRGSLIREGLAFGAARRLSVDWARFADEWPRARTPRDKMLLIDALIHACHVDARFGASRPAATNASSVLLTTSSLARSVATSWSRVHGRRSRRSASRTSSAQTDGKLAAMNRSTSSSELLTGSGSTRRGAWAHPS